VALDHSIFSFLFHVVSDYTKQTVLKVFRRQYLTVLKSQLFLKAGFNFNLSATPTPSSDHRYLLIRKLDLGLAPVTG
jgi:hypothetical protein